MSIFPIQFTIFDVLFDAILIDIVLIVIMLYKWYELKREKVRS